MSRGVWFTLPGGWEHWEALPWRLVSQGQAAASLGSGDFCEGGSSSESPSGAGEVLSSEIRFLWLPSAPTARGKRVRTVLV